MVRGLGCASCHAFTNDFEHLGGGDVVIGQDCDAGGQAVFPPVGIPGNQLDKIQRELLACCQLIQPPYFPVLTVAEVEGRNLAVLWLPGGHGLVKAGLTRLPPVSPPSTRPGTTTSAVTPARWRRRAGR